MIGLEDLGLTPQQATAPVAPSSHRPPVDPYAPGDLVPGSIEAQSGWNAWRGQPVTIVNSPPGAGKSTLVASVVHRLLHATALNIVLATPTVAAGEALAERIAEVAGPGRVIVSGSSFQREIQGVLNKQLNPTAAAVLDGGTRIVVRTIASCRMSPPVADLMVVDEAYQVTFADLTAAAENADQLFLVGDPGQIGPPTSIDVGPWERLRVAPHHRAPEGLTRREDAITLRLPCTYRLGPATTAAIASLYDFEFYSARPEVRLSGYTELESIVLPASHDVADLTMLTATADRVTDLIGRTVTGAYGSAHVLAAEDVAVVAARNEQTTALTAMLTGRGLGEVTVGTADRLQGGQWTAVVSVDPFYGAPVASGHASSVGRLCVMASRHIAHLTWVTSQDWREVAEGSDLDAVDRVRHVRVREGLCGA